MPKDPPTKIKVTEMSRILQADDESVFLVVQNGVGHKISFLDLKNSIISEVVDRINSESSKLEKAERKNNAAISSLSANVKSKFDNYNSILTNTINQYADNVDRNNSAKLEKYVTKIETQIEDLRKEVDNKKLSKITAKNSEISKKLESLKKEITKQLSEILETIDEKHDDLTKKIEKVSLKTDNMTEDFEDSQNILKSRVLELHNQLSIDISDFKAATTSNYQTLSAIVDDFDVKLYGLTINDVDLNSNQIVSEQVKVGDIQTLSSQLQILEEKFNNIQ